MADNGFTPQAVPPGGLGAPPSAASARPLNLFNVPAALSKETGVLQIGLVALTPQEEMDGFQRAGGAGRPAALAAQQVMASLREVTTAKGRQALSLADGTADSFWSQADPRIRNLAMLAFTDVHHVKEEDEASFLQSRQVRVG